MEFKVGKFSWRQIGGDMDPATYGGTIATGDGERLELLKIQPVREYVGDGEAMEVGFPFWTREACYDLQDLTGEGMYRRDTIDGALKSMGLEWHGLQFAADNPEDRALCVAECLLEYGCADEGPCGWAKDILGSTRVRWWGSKRPTGWRYLQTEDIEFRALQKENRCFG